jgi:hypothetical protein
MALPRRRQALAAAQRATRPDQTLLKGSRFPAPACGGRRLRSTACTMRTTPLVPLASLDLPNRGSEAEYAEASIDRQALARYV